MSPSIWQIVIVAVLIILLFGRGKISDLMGDVAKGITSFKKGLKDDDATAEKAEPPKAVGDQQQASLHTEEAKEGSKH